MDSKLISAADERSVLACVYQSADAWVRISDVLTLEDFTSDVTKTLWGLLDEFRQKKVDPSPVAIYDRLPIEVKSQIDNLGGWSFLSGLGELPIGVDGVEFYAQKIHDLTILRRGEQASTKIKDAANSTRDVDKFLREVDTIVNEIPGDIKQDITLLGSISEEYVQERINHPKETPGISSGYPVLDKVTQGFQNGRLYVLGARSSIGKCLAEGTPVLMFNGDIKKVEEVKVGDQLMGIDSQPRNVLSTTSGEDDMFHVVPARGDSFVVNSKHILSFKRYSPGFPGNQEIINMDINDYFNLTRKQQGRLKTWKTGVEFQEQDIPIDPYFLGVLLGDGGMKDQINITTADDVIRQMVYQQADRWNCEIKVRQKENNKSTGYYFVSKNGCWRSRLSWDDIQSIRENEFKKNGRELARQYSVSPALICDIKKKKIFKEKTGHALKEKLISLGLYPSESGSKFIPRQYKINSMSVRLELLAGLMDSDGYLGVSRGFDYISKSKKLAEDVVFLSNSVGFNATMNSCHKSARPGHNGLYYRVYISGDVHKIPTRVSYKKAPVKITRKNALTSGCKIYGSGRGRYYGFMLDGDGLFLLGNFTVTHNSLASLNIIKRLSVDQGLRTLYISTEQTQKDEVSRLISIVAGVPENLINNGTFQYMDGYSEKVQNSIELVSKAPIFFSHDPTFSPDKLYRTIKKYVLSEGVQMVFFDYIKIPTHEIGSKDKWAIVGDLAYGLKAIASTMDVPVFTAVQLNRDGAEQFKLTGEMDASAFANSDMIEQAASVAMILRRLNKKEQDQDNWVGEKRILFIAKNRHGQSQQKILFEMKDGYGELVERGQVYDKA